MFTIVLLFSLVLSIAAIIFGFSLYSTAVYNQYAGIANNISKTAAIVINDQDALDYWEDVYEIYRTTPEEVHQTKGSQTYRLLYASVIDRNLVNMQITLSKIARENKLMKISLMIFDKGSRRLINVYSSDRSEPVGNWYPAASRRSSNIVIHRQAETQWDTDLPYMLVRDDKGYYCTSWTMVAQNEDVIVMVMTDVDMYMVDDDARVFLIQFILLLAALTLGVFMIISRHIKKKVVQPIEDMNLAAKNYIADKADGLPDSYHFQKLDIHTNDEIESLADTFADMEKQISEYLNNLTRATTEKERIRSELNLAAQIQRSSLPSVFPPYPDIREFDIYASVDPAKEVGGDFYDFFLIDDDHLAMVVADVSGKGIPAALFMMACKIVINDLATLGITDPAEILYKVNNRIVRNNTLDMFVTVWLGILQISTGKIKAANGGHEYPCLMRAGKQFEMIKDRHGLVLGGMENVNYYTYEIQMNPGDVLFTYSDGVPESTNTSNQLFGNDRMLNSLNNDTAASVRQLTLNVKKDIDAFVQEAPQFDDITMLALRYNGGGNMNEMTVEAIIDNIPAVTAFVDEKLEALNCPMRAETQIDVAIDELFSNIAKYAYHPDTGPATVRVEVENDPLAVVITFIDNGIPYDPLSHNDPDTTLSAEARSIGGLGIYLVKKTMDDITYEYKNGQNILRIKKEL